MQKPGKILVATQHYPPDSSTTAVYIAAIAEGLAVGNKVVVLSVLVHCLTVVIAWCVVQSIAAPVLFGQIFQLLPPVILITMLPISIAGWGVREATMGLAFGYAGLMSNEGVNISLLFGAVSFLVGIFGGLVWIFSPEKAAQGAKPIEVPK